MDIGVYPFPEARVNVWPDFVDSQIIDTQFCPQCPALSEQMVRFFIIRKNVGNHCFSLSIIYCFIEKHVYFHQYGNKNILIYIKYY